MSTLARTGLRFDPRFDFHFYDLDFCRTARSLGLRLGTWPIAITHQGVGNYGDKWRHLYSEYIAKWGD
jgi:GT2 family glycosyltransferase